MKKRSIVGLFIFTTLAIAAALGGAQDRVFACASQETQADGACWGNEKHSWRLYGEAGAVLLTRGNVPCFLQCADLAIACYKNCAPEWQPSQCASACVHTRRACERRCSEGRDPSVEQP